MSNGKAWWWLRSPGKYRSNAVIVNYDGTIDYTGPYVFLEADYRHCSRVVRPVMWIDVSG